jgi:hypothetical protein
MKCKNQLMTYQMWDGEQDASRGHVLWEPAKRHDGEGMSLRVLTERGDGEDGQDDIN